MKFKFGKFEIEIGELGLIVVCIVGLFGLGVVGIICQTLIDIFGK